MGRSPQQDSSVTNYEPYYDIDRMLSANSDLIPSPPLYNLNDEEIYAAQLDRLAQPLPDGRESPFSSRAPGTAHSVLVSALAHQLSLYGHELNLIPEKALVDFMRMQGVEPFPAEYPVLLVRFTRSADSRALNYEVQIDGGLEIRHTLDPRYSLYTIYSDKIPVTEDYVDIPARMNVIGTLPDVQYGYFSVPTRPISFLESAQDIGIVSEGREAETLSQAVLRAREGIRSGSLARFTEKGLADFEADSFLGRCVNARDFEYYAYRLGATSVNIIPGVQYGAEGTFGDLVSIAVYPSGIALIAQAPLEQIAVIGTRVSVIGAEIIPIVGKIHVRAIPDLTDAQVRDIAANAIVSQINPPYGVWGDGNFKASLATALEKTYGIYAVPRVELFHKDTGEPIEQLKVRPWNLFEIQEEIVFVVDRT